ncbi:MAG: TlpA disulfide reductase family protein [Bryobacteraceae bacterium]|jgi:thiol-disulfide isomerase/thioredoxin
MLALLVVAASLSVGETAPPLRSLEILQAPAGVHGSWRLPQGKPLVLQFWATWSAPSLDQIPRWNALAEKFKDRVPFIAISAEDPEVVAEFLKKRPLAGWVALDPEGAMHRSYGVDTIPRTFVLDARGVLRAVTRLSALRDADFEALAAGRAIHPPDQPGPGEAPKIQPGRVPRLLYPLANDRVPYSVAFEWTPVDGAAAYAIQIADREEFTAVYAEDTTLVPRFALELPVAGPLWWRVRALDPRGKPGPWSVTRKLEILPPPLAASVRAIALNPTSIGSGGVVDALVTLDDRAPEGGASVLISSSDGSLVSLPARVLFPAGEMSARFPIATAKVAGNAEVNILVNSQGERRLATLRIGPQPAPAVLSGVAVRLGVLAAGSVADGVLTLEAPAPGTTTVHLTSSDAARASVPPEVTISASATGATFPVRAAHSTSTANITITASLEGVTKTAAFDVTAADSQDLLAAPVPVAPSYGAAVAGNASNEFSWSSVEGAASYTIEVAGSSQFDTPAAISRTVPMPGVTIDPLAKGTFWWRVRANDVKGSPGNWSTPRLLRVR